MNLQKAEQAVKNWEREVESYRAYENHYSVQRQKAQEGLGQALRELEKAKKPGIKTFHFESSEGCRITGYNQGPASCPLNVDYPCKVTVRPLGGPEPVVLEAFVDSTCVNVPSGQLTLHRGCLAPLVGKKVRVIVEEI